MADYTSRESEKKKLQQLHSTFNTKKSDQALKEWCQVCVCLYVCLLHIFTHPNLAAGFLVNTKSSTPVARCLSCLPSLTNPAPTDSKSHDGQKTTTVKKTSKAYRWKISSTLHQEVVLVHRYFSVAGQGVE